MGILVALAGLTALSAIWSEGPAIEAIYWALVLGGYAALAVAAGTICSRRGGILALSAGIAIVAGVAAGSGLIAMGLHEEPYAIWLDGSWRPAGPFEYPSALAMLQVIALPPLIWTLRRGATWLRFIAAFGLLLALLTVALAGSRVPVVLAGLVLAAGLIPPVRARSPTATPRRTRMAIGAVLVCAVAAVLALAPQQSNGPLGVDFDHGRGRIWSAAVHTASEQPWLGSGAETFELASAPKQGMTAVRYGHNLPLEALVELGVVGLTFVLALYVAVGIVVWKTRHQLAGWLLGTGTLLFLVANLVDWTWHLAGLGAVWALCLGGTLAALQRGFSLKSAEGLDRPWWG